MNRIMPPTYDYLSLKIMSFLLSKKEVMASELTPFGSWKAVDARLMWLEEDGIIEHFYLPKGRRAKHYKFTEKGRTSAMLMTASRMVYYGQLDFSDDRMVEFVQYLSDECSKETVD
jgi:predicted transcriptional regulator